MKKSSSFQQSKPEPLTPKEAANNSAMKKRESSNRDSQISVNNFSKKILAFHSSESSGKGKAVRIKTSATQRHLTSKRSGSRNLIDYNAKLLK